MSSVVDITLTELLLFLALPLFCGALFWRWGLQRLGRDLAVGLVRMTVQLLLIGFYIGYLFDINNIWLNLLWLLVMVTVANLSVVKGAGLRLSRFFWVTQSGLLLGMLVIGCLFLAILVQPQPFYDARYVIPLGGMMLGNCLQGNIRALQSFYGDIRSQQSRYQADLLQGATVSEAVMPFFRNSLRASLMPTISNMATIGIVSLPGMMTGQILGGASPLIAAKYQIAIMAGIFMSMFIAVVLSLKLSLLVAFDGFGMLRRDIFLHPQE